MLPVVCLVLGSVVAAQRGGSPLDGFFNDFTAEWIRGNANLAASTRYFTGDEQDRFERQITPEPLEYRLCHNRGGRERPCEPGEIRSRKHAAIRARFGRRHAVAARHGRPTGAAARLPVS